MKKYTFWGKIFLITLLFSGSLANAQNTRTPKVPVPPKALRSDIKIEHVMAIAPKSVRILYDKLYNSISSR